MQNIGLGTFCAISMCALTFVQLPVAPYVLRNSIQRDVNVGENVTLPCHTTLDYDVDWKHSSPNDSTSDGDYVYTNGKFYELYRGMRFLISQPAKGDFNLVIVGVSANDSGLYTCTEDGGFGNKHLVWLNVVGGGGVNDQDSTVEPGTESFSISTLALTLIVSAVILCLLCAIIVSVCLFRNYERVRNCLIKMFPGRTATQGAGGEKSSGASLLPSKLVQSKTALYTLELRKEDVGKWLMNGGTNRLASENCITEQERQQIDKSELNEKYTALRDIIDSYAVTDPEKFQRIVFVVSDSLERQQLAVSV